MSAPEALDLTITTGAHIEVFPDGDRVTISLTRATLDYAVAIAVCPQSAHDVAVGLMRCALWLNDPAASHPGPDGSTYVSPDGGGAITAFLGDRPPRRQLILSIGTPGRSPRAMLPPSLTVELTAQEALSVALAMFQHSAGARFARQAVAA